MNNLKTKQILLIVSVVMTILSCNAQQAQTALTKVENHLNGELDYTHEALELVERLPNGEEISLGKVDTDGTIHFNLPEFDIKALYASINSKPYKLQGWFLTDRCKDKDMFAETPYDSIYTKEYNLYVKKYGTNVAILEAVSDEKKTKNNGRGIGSSYSWFYIDKAIDYKEECIKTSFGNDNIEATVSVSIQFEKGWNFIEKNQVALPKYDNSIITQPEKIQFTKTSPSSKKVKWFLRQIESDEKIQTAKKLHNLTPLTKEQFEKWAPNKLGDLSITTKAYGKLPERQKNKNNIHLIYTDKSQKNEIELYVVDCAKNPDDLEMINFAYAMENRNKEEKDIKPYVAQYNEGEKTTQLLYKVEDRLFVTASSASLNGEELLEYIKKLNVEKLLKDQ